MFKIHSLLVKFTIILIILAWLFGDPHIVTLDNFFYTFNGIGEYIYLDSDPLQIQIRAEQAKVSKTHY